MTDMIRNYRKSCTAVKKRIAELREIEKLLKNQGDEVKIAELDLTRRINLLYCEHREMEEIIQHLELYQRRVKERGNS
ncbi:MAG: hypothetical protein IJM19_05860 [Ruminococcus sp.]|nr:hypothetical protein [Ruminococcus sp.]MBR6385463.1 hypothetical protein [Ruminococcus sp.]